MTGVLRFPFRLTPSGQVSTATYGSDEEINDAIAAIVLTDIGERPLSPSFGITDPVGMAINDIDVGSDVQSVLSTFGFDEVTITDSNVSPEGGGQASVHLQWERDEPDADPIDEEEDE